ncbi:MAG TPA: ATP-grasp domain-containing protein [Solirubrobacteraceae bacterium]|jgi:biotin carboxylase|nr:ATP-grasp domain-containing protein [Solirubrobacteraceae bacterium]
MIEHGTLLVVATGARAYREYLLRSIATRHRVHLFLTAEPTWERGYVAGWTVLDSTLEADALCVAARALAAREHVAGVLCWDEARILQTAHVAAALGLPGGDPAAIERCRDKHLTRGALAAAGVPQPGSVLVASLDEALATAERLGYPVVLKPRALAASLGVVKVENPDELRAQFAFAHDTTLPEAPHYDDVVLVEQFAGGPEISVDCAVGGGHVWPLFVARKQVGYAPYFEETGHLVDAADPLLRDEHIGEILRATHRALGFVDGMTHVELKLTPTGPKVIEVNARLGGDLIPYLGLLATGIDPGLAAAAVACGRTPELRSDRALVGGVRFFYVEQDDMQIDEVRFVQTLLPADLDLAVATAEPGAIVSPPPKGTLWGRIAYATVLAETAREADAALDAAEAALRVRVRVRAPETAGATR